MRISNLKTACYVLCVIGIVGTAILSGWHSPDVLRLFDGYALWTYAPYFAFGIWTYFCKNTSKMKAILVLSLALVLFAMFALVQNQMHPDAQGGLIYLFLPLWQLVAILISFAVLFGLSRFTKFFR